MLPLPMSFTLALMFYACSDDSGYHRKTKETTIYLRTSTQNYSLPPMLRSVPANFSAYNGTGTNSDLVIYMTQGSEVSQTAIFKWDRTNEWSAKVAVETESPQNIYYVYGYMPADAANASISPYNASYVNGSTMVLSNLRTVSTEDVCVITGAATENTAANFDIINSTTPVTPGSFSITAKESDNYLYVLMNHIYAKLGLHFKVEGPSSYYYSLRGIRLKKVEMITGIGELTVNVHSGSADPALNYNEETGTPQTITLFDVSSDDDTSNDAGIEITPTGIEIPAFFTPMQSGDSKHLKFISHYDVYYRDTDGNITDTLVRGNCITPNEWTLSPQSGQEFGSGKQITVSATIIPTYLYQLADPDLVNPKIKLQ